MKAVGIREPGFLQPPSQTRLTWEAWHTLASRTLIIRGSSSQTLLLAGPGRSSPARGEGRPTAATRAAGLARGWGVRPCLRRPIKITEAAAWRISVLHEKYNSPSQPSQPSRVWCSSEGAPLGLRSPHTSRVYGKDPRLSSLPQPSLPRNPFCPPDSPAQSLRGGLSSSRPGSGAST